MEEATNPCHTTLQSKTTEAVLACPSCGHENQVVTWDLLEATRNPERAAQLASGQLLVHACPNCGTLIPLNYPLFYVDRDRKVAAYYPAGQGELPALATLFTQAVNRFHGVDLSSLRRQEFEMRVVPERHELAEKVNAWQAGLDDELLEVFKVSLLRELSARNLDLHLADLQFTGLRDAPTPDDPNAKLEFILFSEQVNDKGEPEVVPANAQIAIPVEAYRRLAKSLDVRIQIDRSHSPIVNRAWANEILTAAEQESERG